MPIGDAQSPLCDEENAQRQAMDRETFDRVRRAVRALPQTYREVVALRYLQQLETEEVCELLGITANAMQVRLNRAKKQLRTHLAGLIEEKS